jgi:DNA topoisomerase I
MVKLLIVESPGKIKKLKSILGTDWDVKASVGHIRQLSNEGESSLGFTIAQDHLDCHYIPRDERARKTIAGLKAAAKQASEVVLASDPDREGETIAWHIAQVLHLKQPKRVIYQEITETAVRAAIANPRRLDMHLVEAGRCRDCLDKLVGYKGSPLVWRLNNGAKSNRQPYISFVSGSEKSWHLCLRIIGRCLWSMRRGSGLFSTVIWRFLLRLRLLRSRMNHRWMIQAARRW